MSHISFSEIKNWGKCPFYHKLMYIDGLKVFEGNVYTAFGTAMHAACEQVADLNNEELLELFDLQFQIELKLLETEYDEVLASDMFKQGPRILEHLKTKTEEYFGDYEILSVEEKLYENVWLEEPELLFKGFIDMVLRVGDEIHILDWKTSTKGWGRYQKNDPLLKYQLLYYKHYYAQKHGVKLDKIKTHFGILKRAVSKDHIEFYEIKSNKEKITEALNFLKRFRYNVENKKFIKNRLACKFCEFKDTEYCI